jgi:hypothetical protein
MISVGSGKLPVPPQDLAAFISDAVAHRREGRSALEKITGSHPPERSQYLAAAGLHGLNSFKSNAWAAVSDNANRPAATRHLVIPGPFLE